MSWFGIIVALIIGYFLGKFDPVIRNALGIKQAQKNTGVVNDLN